jgi:hypothetical protein
VVNLAFEYIVVFAETKLDLVRLLNEVLPWSAAANQTAAEFQICTSGRSDQSELDRLPPSFSVLCSITYAMVDIHTQDKTLDKVVGSTSHNTYLSSTSRMG